MSSHDSPLAVIILAAGKGTRMKSAKPKVLHEIAGRPIVQWLIEAVENLNPEKIIVVVGQDSDDVTKAVQPHACVVQTEQKGTGDAVKPALNLLKNFKGKVLILLGDEPFLPADAIQKMIAWDGLSVMAIRPLSAKGLGRIIVNDDQTLDRIVEEKDCTEEEKKTRLCNAGNFCVPAAHLEKWISQIDNKNAQGEYYLTDLPQIAEKDGFLTYVVEADVARMHWGINTRAQLAEAEHNAQNMLRQHAMDNGVTFIDPQSVHLSWDTQFGQDVLVEPNIFFGPGVTVDNNVTIKAFSHLEGVHIKSGVQVGPFARLRPGTILEENAKIGNFVEVKNAHIGQGSKVNHLSYVGDAQVGSSCNIGAGTITCNYDGFEKSQTTLGDNVFVGSNSTLVAPVSLSDGSYIAAGSTITIDIPEDALGIARSRTEFKDGWAKKFKSMKDGKKGKAA